MSDQSTPDMPPTEDTTLPPDDTASAVTPAGQDAPASAKATARPRKPRAKKTATTASTAAEPAPEPAPPAPAETAAEDDMPPRRQTAAKKAAGKTRRTADSNEAVPSARAVVRNAREVARNARQAARDIGERAGRTMREVADVASEAAREVAGMASETAKGVAEMAGDTARNAIQIASEGAQVMAQLAEDGAKVAAQLAGDTAKAAGQIAREVALQMAQAYLRKSTLTLPLPESLLNKQVRKMVQDHPSVDHLTVYCGDDRLTVAVDGHHNRLVYTLELEFDVLECRISRHERYLRVRQVDESLDAQFRQSNIVASWLTRQVGRGAFYVANRLPTRSPVNMALQDIPGVSREGPRLWRIDLNRTELADLFSNRTWMVDKLLSLTDLSVLPGLTTLRDSRELLMQLVNQFEIRDLRVRPGRIEVLVGINPG